MNNLNSNDFPPNIDPQVYAWLACIVGSACVGHFTALEQNTLGNWLILVGQFLETTCAQQQLIEARIQNQCININSRQFKSGGSYYTNNNFNNKNEIDFLLEAVNKLQQELENLKNNKKE